MIYRLTSLSGVAKTGTLYTRCGMHAMHIRLAGGFIARFFGLMLRAPLEPMHGLLLTHCASVHTAFMRAPIDVLYLDERGTVLKCVPRLKPWRASTSRDARNTHVGRRVRRVHALELRAGAIDELGICTGDRLAHPLWDGHSSSTPAPTQGRGTQAERGAAMIEFILVGPIITLLGLGVLQYGLLFFAKNHLNHASFMAARAGSMGNGDLQNVRTAYESALVPLYGGGDNDGELAAALSKAKADVGQFVRIELLNPTSASFDDWNDPALQTAVGAGRRVIPNAGQASKDPTQIGPRSLQNIQDANLIKLRITHGVEPKVPLVRTIYSRYLQWLNPGTDSFHTQLVNAGRVPVITHATLHMHSDAIEQASTVLMPDSVPGSGTGNPSNPNLPIPEAPPTCTGAGCEPTDPPGSPTDPGEATQPHVDACDAGVAVIGEVEADILFPFGMSSVADMLQEGREFLDGLIAEANVNPPTKLHIVGHTDQIGTDAFNLTLSQARAASVRDYLLANGFPNVPITIEGRGASEPKVQLSQCSGASDAALQTCLAPNRRVVIVADGIHPKP